MQHRTLSILIGTLCIGAAAGIAFFSQDSLAIEMPPGSASADESLEIEADGQVPAEPTPVGVANDAVYHPGASGAATAMEAGKQGPRTNTGGWTKGVIKGDIQLAVSVLDRLGSITVIVEEARNAFDNGGNFERANRLVVAAKRDRGTPTFEVHDVPFSAYPYTVTVRAAGLNGSQRTVVIDQENPLVDDVILSITPGSPYSILVRDQDAGPHVGVDISLVPIGTPLGRPRHAGTTDNFGSAVFDDVLAGAYQLSASVQNQPLGEPQQVVVQPGLRSFRTKVQGQGHTMVIPRGVELNLQIHDIAGYGIPGAKVTATASDRIRHTTLPAESDDIGRAKYPHLQPGVWQITIEHELCQRVDLQIHLKPDQAPVHRKVRLVRSRR